MAQCLRCDRYYLEPYNEQGDHPCPHCGLTPEDRADYTYTRAGGWELKDEEQTMRNNDSDANSSLTVLVLIFLALLVFCAWNDSRPVLSAPKPAAQQGR